MGDGAVVLPVAGVSKADWPDLTTPVAAVGRVR